MNTCSVFHYPPCEACGHTPDKPRKYSTRLRQWVCRQCYTKRNTNA